MNSTLPLRARKPADPVVRLIVGHWVLGAVLGMACAALMIWLDVGGLSGLLFRGGHASFDALFLMFGGFAITFGGAVSASAVMAIPVDEPGRSVGRRR